MLPRDRALGRLARAVADAPVETGVVIVEADGTPFAWAGRHRLPPESQGGSIDFRRAPYYAVLEGRRELPNQRTAIVSLLLAADSTVPDQGRSLARRFERRAGVGVEVLLTGIAPDTSDVFDYLEPTADGGSRLLFSVQLAPPSQTEAHERTYRSAVPRLLLAAVLALLVALVVAAPGWARFALLGLLVAILTRAPLDGALDVPALFSSYAFHHPLLGPLSESASPLAAVSVVVALLALAIRPRLDVPRWLGMPVAGVLLLAAPYLVSRLGRGIKCRSTVCPPSSGSSGNWSCFSWRLPS